MFELPPRPGGGDLCEGRFRNTVVVWVTFDTKETLYDYLETQKGKEDHGEGDDMSSIATFEMYDLTPVSGRIPGIE